MASRLAIMCVANKLPASLAVELDEYFNRLSPWLKTEFIRLKPGSNKKQEAQMILDKIEAGDFLVLCDEKGRGTDSVAFSQYLQRWIQDVPRRIVFLIGGAYGVDDEVKAKARFVWRLSDLTLSHRVALLVLTEQVYRAMTILKGTPYHHAN